VFSRSVRIGHHFPLPEDGTVTEARRQGGS
jgi:hypothetical protein